MSEECLEPGCTHTALKYEDSGHWIDAVDFSGADVQLWLDMYSCPIGHRYHLVDENKTRMLL